MASGGLSEADLAARIRSGDRAALSRAITLAESQRPDHRARAASLLQTLLPQTGGARRVGITGVPGVGKSTLIDALGGALLAQGHKVAVLAIDPSSTRSGGAILGDKTRMRRLAHEANAFVRPSPNAGTLGGVAAKTRETMLLLEAAGYDVVIVETVGVGQAETAVADMVDTFVAVMLPGAGDELQGIKKGLLERADIIVVNKADGDMRTAASHAAADLMSAVKILAREAPPAVLTVSAQEAEGMDRLWEAVLSHHREATASGRFDARRREQSVVWMRQMIAEALQRRFAERVGARLSETEDAVRRGEVAPSEAALRLLGEG